MVFNPMSVPKTMSPVRTRGACVIMFSCVGVRLSFTRSEVVPQRETDLRRIIFKVYMCGAEATEKTKKLMNA